MTRVLQLLIRAYQVFLRPALHALGGGPCCRFQPSCSRYFLESLERHGAWRGSLLGVRRLLRCHPLGGHGHDPVPAPRENTPS